MTTVIGWTLVTCVLLANAYAIICLLPEMYRAILIAKKEIEEIKEQYESKMETNAKKGRW